MAASKSRIDGEPTPTAASSSLPVRLLVPAIAVTGIALFVLVGLPWLRVITPRWLINGAAISFLWALLVAVLLLVPVVIVGGLWSLSAAVAFGRRGDRRALERKLRWLLLASSGLAGLIAMELACQLTLRLSQRLPNLPTEFAKSARSRGQRSDTERGTDPARDLAGLRTAEPSTVDGLYMVVIGESSARGEPYHPWLSVGELVGRQLERVFPGRRIRVDVRAEGGVCLEQAILRLEDLDERPSAIIVFSGHNEFQARYGWSRNVRHYREEGPESPLALLELMRTISSTARLILSSLDRYYGEKPPPPRVTRELVDHPICSPKEYAFLRADFHRRLDGLTAYCEQIGALPVLIVPPSNDGAFEPSRSVLSGSTAVDARAAFARQFEEARAAESANVDASIAAYRALVAQHPEFAEAQYRLAQLLEREGAWDEARVHFTLARDLDGAPLRCPSDFRSAISDVARRHRALLVDGPGIVERTSPHGIGDDSLFHDAHHLNLTGMIALAQELLDQLKKRRAFGWPEATPVPRIELEACAQYYELDANKWATVCDRSALFFARTAFVRYDPDQRLKLADQYAKTGRSLLAGQPLPEYAPASLAPAAAILALTRTGSSQGTRATSP
jgi:hypothetical protein